MSRKTSPQRRAAFFKALRETGNQTIAAERARVSRSWVHLQRSIDPAFKAEVAAAVAEAREDLLKERRTGSMKPGRCWRHLDGEELVVRGSRGRRVQVARARLRQWTPRLEERFLAVLAATCNVRAASASAGLSLASAYKHRERWPGFARRWEEAVAAGYPRLDGVLLSGAIALLDPEISPGEPQMPPLEPMSVDHAIALARLYEKRAREHGRRG